MQEQNQEKSKTRSKRKSVIFIIISVILLALVEPSDKGFGYYIGALLTQLVIWSVILGIIALLLKKFWSNKSESFLYLFSILFLIASSLAFLVGIGEFFLLNF